MSVFDINGWKELEGVRIKFDKDGTPMIILDDDGVRGYTFEEMMIDFWDGCYDNGDEEENED